MVQRLQRPWMRMQAHAGYFLSSTERGSCRQGLGVRSLSQAAGCRLPPVPVAQRGTTSQSLSETAASIHCWQQVARSC